MNITTCNFVSVCVCVYVYTYTRTIRQHVHMNTTIQIFVCFCLCACVCGVCVSQYTRHIYMLPHRHRSNPMYKSICTYIYVYIHIYIYICLKKIRRSHLPWAALRVEFHGGRFNNVCC